MAKPVAHALIVPPRDQERLVHAGSRPCIYVGRASRCVRCAPVGGPRGLPLGGNSVSDCIDPKQQVVSGALSWAQSLRLSVTLYTPRLVLIHKLGLKPPRSAREADEAIPVKCFTNCSGISPAWDHVGRAWMCWHQHDPHGHA